MTIVHTGPTTAEFIVSVVVAGVLGPALAALASWGADRRKFGHEGRLKASDDLIERIEAVAVALEGLGAACAKTRQAYSALGGLEPMAEPRAVSPLVWTAADAYQQARGLIARLGMRPHADRAMVDKAEAAAESLNASTEAVRLHLIRRVAVEGVSGRKVAAEPPVERVTEHIEKGYALTTEYREQARVAIGRLLGTAPSIAPANAHRVKEGTP